MIFDISNIRLYGLRKDKLMQKKCLEPWVDENTRILIVGTMPGEESLQQQTYYAHPRNKFWSYMAAILNNGQALNTTDEKRCLLSSKNIGLWDSLSVCEREGSLDSNIKKQQPNDFSKFQSVEYILFNGQKAAQYFKAYNGEYLSKRKFFELPSTSPANARYNLDKLIKEWGNSLSLFD